VILQVIALFLTVPYLVMIDEQAKTKGMQVLVLVLVLAVLVYLIFVMTSMSVKPVNL